MSAVPEAVFERSLCIRYPFAAVAGVSIPVDDIVGTPSFFEILVSDTGAVQPAFGTSVCKTATSDCLVEIVV